MQRFLREPLGELSIQEFSARYEEKIGLIRKYFPPSVAQVYATPSLASDGSVEWFTDGEGLVTPYANLNEVQQAALLKAYAMQQQAVEQLVATLSDRGTTHEAGKVRELLFAVDKKNLYSLEGHPVITRWGEGGTQPLGLVPVQLATAPMKQRRWWLWLLAVLLLLALLAALVWWRSPSWFGVAAPESVSKSVFELVPESPPVPASVQTDIEVVCTADEFAPENAVKPALPPEFVVVMDTSGSMNLNVHTPVGEDDRVWQALRRKMDRARPLLFMQNPSLMSSGDTEAFFRLFKSLGPLGDGLPDNIRKWLEGPVREDVAKEALIRVIDGLPTDIATKLVTFSAGDCQAPPRYHGEFVGEERLLLKDRIRGLTSIGGTTLVTSMVMAANMVDGKNRDALILMIVDGDDSCNENICTVAQSIAKAKPRLKINVMDVTGRGLADCIAKVTGGDAYQSRDPSEISRMLAFASEAVIKPKRQCVGLR